MNNEDVVVRDAREAPYPECHFENLNITRGVKLKFQEVDESLCMGVPVCVCVFLIGPPVFLSVRLPVCVLRLLSFVAMFVCVLPSVCAPVSICPRALV